MSAGRFAIVAVYADREDCEAHPTRYDTADAAGLAAIGLAARDAQEGNGCGHLRNDQGRSPLDIETWCADVPVNAPVWCVRAVQP